MRINFSTTSGKIVGSEAATDTRHITNQREILPGNVEFTYQVSFVNRTGVPIHASLRSGLIIPLDVDFTSDGTFIVRVEYSINESVRKNLSALLSRSEITNPVIEAFKSTYCVQSAEWKNSFMRDIVHMEYVYDFNTIFDGKGSCYLKEHDILVSHGVPGDDVPYHPKCTEADDFMMPEKQDSNQAVMNFFLCSNTKSSEPKFISVHGVTLKLTPEYHPSIQPGLYIRKDRCLIKDNLSDSIYYPPKEFSERGIFSTQEEAKSHAAGGIDFQFRLKDIDLKLKEKDAELAESKREFEFAKVMMDKERAELNEYYEKRSMERKESLEVTKHLPTIIAGTAAIFLAVKAFL